MPAPKQWPNEDGWQLSKQFGPPDMVIKSEPYTMPAHGQDVWFKPLVEVPLTEPRWVRAVEIRPSTPAGRKIVHHAIAFLQQEEPSENGGAPRASNGLLMEWAVNKQYDIYRAKDVYKRQPRDRRCSLPALQGSHGPRHGEAGSG